MLKWQRPELLDHLGWLYVTKCRRYLVCRTAPTCYRLNYMEGESFVRQEFPQLQQAKAAAEQHDLFHSVS